MKSLFTHENSDLRTKVFHLEEEVSELKEENGKLEIYYKQLFDENSKLREIINDIRNLTYANPA